MPMELGFSVSFAPYDIEHPSEERLISGTAVVVPGFSANIRHNLWKAKGDFALSAGLNISGGYNAGERRGLSSRYANFMFPLTINAAYGLGATNFSTRKFGASSRRRIRIFYNRYC
ncbi:hypothetical protein RCC89_12585 [Cytophagaceae bacterium ABcell3]|nr:hypothetical protein RCC89_12585 [Cytophagaceae bacterium ABcell3]